MRHALAALEAEGGNVTGVATPLKIQKLKKKVIKQNKKTEEMKREKEI